MSFDQAFYTIGRLDLLSYQDTVVHRLDARVKVAATLVFVIMVVSYPKYEVLSLVPFLLFPVLMVSLGDLPALFLVRKVLVVSPFAVCIGILNPVFDHGTVTVLGTAVSAGWISFLSILVKFVLTISAALILIATTSFPGVCGALRRFGVPAVFVSQLLFLYRYLFVLLEETLRILRARELRSFGGRGQEAKVAVRIIGNLFLRTVERAERIYRAMLSRGFAGDIPVLRRRGMGAADAVFLTVAVLSFSAFRFLPVGEWTGRFAQELLR